MAPELVIFLLGSLGLLNAWATYAVFRDDLSTSGQRAAQVLLVWLVPLMGAALTLYLKRGLPEPPSGRYPGVPDPGDDFGASGRNVRQINRAIETESSGEGGANE